TMIRSRCCFSRGVTQPSDIKRPRNGSLTGIEFFESAHKRNLSKGNQGVPDPAGNAYNESCHEASPHPYEHLEPQARMLACVLVLSASRVGRAAVAQSPQSLRRRLVFPFLPSSLQGIRVLTLTFLPT